LGQGVKSWKGERFLRNDHTAVGKSRKSSPEEDVKKGVVNGGGKEG